MNDDSAARSDHIHGGFSYLDSELEEQMRYITVDMICKTEFPRLHVEDGWVHCEVGAISTSMPVTDIHPPTDVTWEMALIMVAAIFLGFVIGRRSLK